MADDAVQNQDAETEETPNREAVTDDNGVTGETSSEEATNAQTVDAKADPKDAEIEDLKSQLLRTRADFDNFRRRTRQEKEELSQFATKKLLTDLLPVVDNFDRAMVAVETADEQVKAGIEMVHRQLTQVLSQYGVAPMEAEGEPFDPTRHEAVMQEAADGVDANVVIAELQKGYLLHDKVLRPAMVKVSV